MPSCLVVRDVSTALDMTKKHIGTFAAGLLIAVSLTFSNQTQAGGTWQNLAPMPAPRQELATAVLNGKIFVLAGYDSAGLSTDSVFVYNPATNAWASAHPLPQINNHNSAAVADGKLYSFAGLSNSTYRYEPTTDSWTEVASTTESHAGTAAVGVLNDKIFIAGGGTGTALEVYDPTTNTWTNLAPMNVPRNHCGGGIINGEFYVVGGRDSDLAPTALEVYHPQTNTWTSLAPMPTARSGIGVAVVHGELYVFGGEIPVLHGDVQVYNPVSNSWRQLDNMPTPRHGIWASVIGNRIYLAGGGAKQGFGATDLTDVFIVNSKGVFANISTRLKVDLGDNALIGGFIISGTGAKRILIRAIGPSLPTPGALVNPRLEFHDASGQLIAANDDWRDAPNEQEIIDSALAPTNDFESAILMTVEPDYYTAIVRGENSGTGVALVEVYDLESGSDANLANISTRGFVQTENNVLIGGLILTGQEPRRVILRAIGPSLNISKPLADPVLELHDANGGLLGANQNWRDTQEEEILATTSPPSNDLEAAIVQMLPPANYTAIVKGANNTTGIALVEAYALDLVP